MRERWHSAKDRNGVCTVMDRFRKIRKDKIIEYQ